MAIDCKCPFCGKGYRLKDNQKGKSVVCANPKCKKGFNVPMFQEVAISQEELDATAAMAFSDEPAAVLVEELTVAVTCVKCDHNWKVEASKAGKNALCPECRAPNRVPLPKKEDKADWRSAGDGKPTLARRDTGPALEGAWTSGNAGVISQQTAKEIVKSREAEEEPEERRARLIKRLVYSTMLLAVIGAGVYFAIGNRRVAKMETSMADAIAEIKGPDAPKGKKFEALVMRSSAEYKSRTAKTKEEAAEALTDFRFARNAINQPTDPDHLPMQIDIALSMVNLFDEAKKLGAKDLIKDVRQTLEVVPMNEIDLLTDAYRELTKQYATKDPSFAINIVSQRLATPSPDAQELVGQVGLELFKLNLKTEAESVYGKAPSADTPAFVALRSLLGKPALKPLEKGPLPSNVSARIGSAMATAIQGDAAKVKSIADAPGKADERARALVAGANEMIETNAAEAVNLLEIAAKLLEKDARKDVSPWLAVRCCKLLAKAGKPDSADMLAESIADEKIRSWAKLEILRGRLKASGSAKQADTMLDAIGDPTKFAAAAKAREELARHNARGGDPYSKAVLDTLAKGSVKPFAISGTVLGAQDRALDK